MSILLTLLIIFFFEQFKVQNNFRKNFCFSNYFKINLEFFIFAPSEIQFATINHSLS